MNNDLWTRWTEHYSRKGLDSTSICQDGIIDPAIYQNAKRKILFVLKEVNNYPGGKLQIALSNGPRFQMWFAVSRWAAGLLNDFPRYKDINHHHIRTESIKSIAAINLKKASGGADAWSSQINLYAHFDRELLIEEIKSISPEIIVACGTFDTLVWLLNLDINPKEIKEPCHYLKSERLLIINWRHPSRVGGKSSYDELAKAVGNHIQELATL